QILELLEPTAANQPISSPAALLCRVEGLLLRGTGATSVDAFLVDHWFNKLLHFSPANDSDGNEEKGRAGAGAGDDCSLSDASDSGNQSEKQQEQQEDQVAFATRAVCGIGEGVAGLAAMTGRKLRIRHCSAQQHRGQEKTAFSTDHKSGSLVCWPVRERTSFSATAAATGVDDPPPLIQLEDVDCNTEFNDETVTEAESPPPPDAAGAVQAVLQVHCADGEISAQALEVLHGVGRLLVPLLTDVLDRDQEIVRRRSTEALLSLSSMNLRRTDLMGMIEEVVRVAQKLTDAARVCFFFVDDPEEELWVAKAVGFCYGARIKIGEGLSGRAAATGEIINVIDSYDDSRFDRRFDEQTGCITRSAMCAPIPPPDYAVLGIARRRSAAASHKKRHDASMAQATAGESQPQPQSGSSHKQKVRVGSPSPSSSRGGVQVSQEGSGPTGGVVKWPRHHIQGLSQTDRRPLAVLKVTDKRGTGVFSEHDEEALWRLCVCVESLLRNKAAEVALLTSGMVERSLVRKSNSVGGTGGAWSNYARVQSTIMRLYSQASFPIDVAMRGRMHMRKKRGSTATVHSGGDLAGGGGGGGFLRRSLSGSKFASADLRQASLHSDDARRASESDTPISGGKAVVGGGERCSTSSGGKGISCASSSGVGDGVGQILQGESTQEDSKLVDLSMSLFDMTAEKLLSLVQRFFQYMGLMSMFKISNQKMQSFTRAVERRYKHHPFHNLTHAVSVTHVSFTIAKTTQAGSLLRPLDKLGLLVAAFCHDIDHPGNNNAYEVNSLSPLALLYGDSSVLERHHVFITYQQVLLEEGGANNIFSGLTRAQFRDVRQTIVQAILGTDMSAHMEHCAEVFRFAENAKALRATRTRGGQSVRVNKSRTPTRSSGTCTGPTGAKDGATPDGTGACGGQRGHAGCGGRGPAPPAEHIFNVHNARDRSFLTRTIIHCADLSGQVLDNSLALEWGKRILEEFRLQARLEGNLGLPRTTVANGDLETTTKGQLFFAAKV
ncbi:unnamed protein product, partial [Hapterophycus canaliculatus]